MNMLGLIFADEHSSDISDLTTRRTFAAIPFGARYRIIDFFISNMTNSGVRNIGVIATTKYESLMGHVRYGGEWDLHRRKTGLTVLPPFSFFNGEERYENVLEALQANINYIKENSEPYVLFTCCNAIGNIDYSAMLEQHIESGARFTCLCTKDPTNKTEGMQTTEYVLDEDNRIEDIIIHDDMTPDAYVATSTYIMGREDLLDILADSLEKHKMSFRKDVLLPALKDSKVMAYVTDEKVLFVDSVASYLKSNQFFRLLCRMCCVFAHGPEWYSQIIPKIRRTSIPELAVFGLYPVFRSAVLFVWCDHRSSDLHVVQIERVIG